MQELIVRIKALVGKAFTFKEEPKKEETCFKIGDYHFNSVTQILSHTGIEQELSHREAEILKRRENRNQVVNTQNILLDLLGGRQLLQFTQPARVHH